MFFAEQKDMDLFATLGETPIGDSPTFFIIFEPDYKPNPAGGKGLLIPIPKLRYFPAADSPLIFSKQLFFPIRENPCNLWITPFPCSSVAHREHFSLALIMI